MENNLSVHLIYFQCKQCNHSKVNLDTPKLTWNVLFEIHSIFTKYSRFIQSSRFIQNSRFIQSSRSILYSRFIQDSLNIQHLFKVQDLLKIHSIFKTADQPRCHAASVQHFECSADYWHQLFISQLAIISTR